MAVAIVFFLLRHMSKVIIYGFIKCVHIGVVDCFEKKFLGSLKLKMVKNIVIIKTRRVYYL